MEFPQTLEILNQIIQIIALQNPPTILKHNLASTFLSEFLVQIQDVQVHLRFSGWGDDKS